MIEVTTCPTCGAPLASPALRGNCPECLLRLVVTPLPGKAAPPANPGDGCSPQASRSDRTRFFGDYEIQREIARGGMGAVYAARQISLNRQVALKMVAAGQLATPALVQRFRIEAEAAARLHHPNIVPIYEVGEHQGQHFYSMELVEGGNLSDWILNTHPVNTERAPAPRERKANHIEYSVRRAAILTAKVAHAVHYAHQRGVLHRDLKPTNILLDTAGEPRVADFGLAKLVESDSDLTQSAAVLGTPAYMAPEQAAGRVKQLTTAADVYGLGAILYELLTGQPPFKADTALETMRRVVEEEPEQPRSLNPQLDSDLETICLKCLRKESAARYGSAEALADELERWLAGEPILARPAAATERLVRWCRRKPALATALGAAAILLLVIAVGSPIAAFRIRRAQQEAVGQLRESYLAHAQANRLSGRPGRRVESLEVIRKAAALNPSPELREALRNEAIACLALTDLRVARQWEMKSGRWDGRLCFDADAQFYALSDRTNISIRRVADDGETARLPGQRATVNWIHGFNPDSRYLSAFYRDDTTRVWDLKRHEVALRLPGDNPPAFDADGRIAAVQRLDGSVSILALDPSNEVRRVTVGKPLSNLKIHPGSGLLAGIPADKQSVEVFDANTGQILHSLPLPARGRRIAFSRDGRRLAAGTLKGHLIVWDATKGERQWETRAHETQVNDLVFSRAGDLLASTSWEGSLRLWDAATGRLVITHPGSSYELQFSANDHQLAHVQSASHASLLEVIAHPEFRLLQPARPGVYRWSLAFTPDSRLLATGGEEIRFWDFASGTELASMRLYDFRSLHFLRDGRSAISSGFEGLLRWDLDSHEVTRTNLVRFGSYRRLIPETNVLHSAVSDDGCFVLVADRPRNRALLVELDNPTNFVAFGPHRGVQYVAISPDRRFIATGSYQGAGAKVWDVATRKVVSELPTENHVRVAFSPDGRWLATSAEKVRLYECESWQLHRQLPLQREGTSPDDTIFSPDSNLLAVGHSPQGIHLFSPTTGQRLAVLEAPLPATLSRLAFSPDGRTLAALQYDQAVQLWDLPRLRGQLRPMGLDWETPSVLGDVSPPATSPIFVEIVGNKPTAGGE